MADQYSTTTSDATAGDKQASPTALSKVVSSADSLAERRKNDEALRADDLREWQQNNEFYKGNQWVFWNRVTQKIETLPVADGDKPRYKVRLKQNRIRTGVHRWAAQMTKNKPMVYASPDTSNVRDIKAAEVAQSLNEHLWRELNLTSLVQRAIIFAALSQGYLLVEYDPFAGRPIEHVINPETGAPADGPLAQMVLEQVIEQADAYGVPAEQVRAKVTKTTYEGEISVRALSGMNVLVDPAAEDFEHAKYAIVTHSLTPDEIAARWGKTVTPDAMPTETQPALMFQRLTDKRPQTVRRVYCGYFPPQPALPRGKYVVWIESPNTVLYEGDWNFPFNDLPLIKMPGHESTAGPLDLPPTTEARPLQKELNRSVSQVVEHKDLTLRPQMIGPVGSLRTRLTAEPGVYMEYQPVAGLAPQWREMPNLPSYVFEHIALIKGEIDEVYNAMPNQRDQLPARIDSGGAVDLIQETVADQLLPPIRRLEDALAKLGYFMAMLAQAYYSEPRLLKLKGTNGSWQTLQFQSADLRGGFSFHAEVGSGLPRTRAGKQDRIEFLLKNQLIDGPTALKFLDMADMTGVTARVEADEDQALREHERLIAGQPVSIQAVSSAMQEIQDPDADPDGDGRPDREYNPGYWQQWAQMLLQQAMVAPTIYESPDVHVRVHREYMTSAEFEALPVDAQSRFVEHYEQTYDRMMQLRLMTPSDPPKINLRLQGATSVPVQTALLNKAGIEVSQQDVAQPPIDTWVTDDVTAPLAQDTGDNHMDAAAQLQQMQQAEETHQLKTAKAANEAALAAHRADGAAQANQQAADAHEQRMRQVQQQQSHGR